MNRMVFCQLIEESKKYSYGFASDDLSGQVIFDVKGNCTVLKQPNPHTGIGQNPIFICDKYRDEFKKGVFHEKLSYEF